MGAIKYGNYFINDEGNGRLSIRLQVTDPDGKRRNQRYARHKYTHLKSRADLEALVLRLNNRPSERLEIRTAFIPPEYLEEFRTQLLVEIPTAKDARYHFNKILKTYFLNFFINHMKCPDPVQWVQHEAKWAASLLGQSENEAHNIFGKRRVSYKTISKTIQLANRFMLFLHKKNPAEFPRVTFDPIGRGARSTYIARRELGRAERGRYIRDEDWLLIESKLPQAISAYVKLAYYYGLRRNEAMGFDSTDAVKQGHLLITKQRTSVDTYGPLKGRKTRKTPHWFSTAQEAFDLIEEARGARLHPDTVYEKWCIYIKSLGLSYDLHDLRRTFITRALRLHAPRDVQMAVGHASLATTMAYAQDDRDTSDEVFVPK